MTSTLNGNRWVKAVRSRTILQSPALLYRFWRNPKNLEKLICHPVEITPISPTESHWKVSAPFGCRPVEWDSVIIDDQVNRLIVWRSRAGADVANVGSVRFNAVPGDLGTEVTVTLEYDPPGGRFASWVAKLSANEPGRQAAQVLRRFGALVENEITPVDDPTTLVQAHSFAP